MSIVVRALNLEFNGKHVFYIWTRVNQKDDGEDQEYQQDHRHRLTQEVWESPRHRLGLVVVIDMAVGISVPPRIWMNCGSMCEESPIKLILSEAGSVRASWRLSTNSWRPRSMRRLSNAHFALKWDSRWCLIGLGGFRQPQTLVCDGCIDSKSPRRVVFDGKEEINKLRGRPWICGRRIIFASPTFQRAHGI